MKKIIISALCVLTILAASCIDSAAWGKREHAAIAYIAEQNLSPKARKAAEEILHGEKLSSYASWLDYYKPQMLMKLTKPQNGKMWRTIPHTFHVDSSLCAYRYPEHSCVTVLEESVEKLKHRKELDDSTTLQCLLNIIHLTGDMHCPCHVIYADKRDRHIGGFDVIYKGEKVRLHKVWDSMVTNETLPGGVEDLAYWAMTSTRKEVKGYTKGSLYDWGSDTAQSSCEVFEVQKGDELPNTYMYYYSRLALRQIEKAGYRLAALLESIF